MTGEVAPMGDTAAIIWTGSTAEAQRLAGVLQGAVSAGAAWAERVEDVIPGAASVVVVVDPAPGDAVQVAERVVRDLGRVEPDDAARRTTARRNHEIDVVFDGPDTAEVAATLGCTTAELAERLAASVLEVAFLGFVPGFAYLAGLPPAVAAVPRRERPRSSVAPGSVALGGGYAGIYPLGSPGGWQLVGRTDAVLLDPVTPPYARLAPGDTVRFRPVEQVGAPPSYVRPPLRAASGRRALVLEPGPETTVQDLGRTGVAASGVPRAGPADPAAFALATALVGNAPGAGALEVAYEGPALHFETAGAVAVVGDAPLLVGGREMPACVVEEVPAGTVVRVGRLRSGARAYLAVAGGVEPEPLFGSRANDTVSGLGYGRLRRGDELSIGVPGRPRGRCSVPDAPARPAVLRLVPGPGPGPLADVRGSLEALLHGGFTVDPASNRAGARLVPLADGPHAGGPAGVPSHGMVTGAVQLPPDGRPIVLGPDHGTVGGYAVVGVVITADLPVLGQLRAGDEVRFEVVDLAGARRAHDDLRRRLAASLSGWYPVSGAAR
jgi:KipI family sensor histidine kinase inhibitor